MRDNTEYDLRFLRDGTPELRKHICESREHTGEPYVTFFELRDLRRELESRGYASEKIDRMFRELAASQRDTWFEYR